MVGITQQHGAFGTQFGDFRHRFAIVELAAVAVAGERGVHDARAQIAILQRRQRRLATGVLQGNHVLALHFLVLRGLRRSGDGVVGHTVKHCLVIDDDRGIAHFLQHVLCKLGLQRRDLAVHGLQLVLVGIGQLGAGADKILVVTLDQANAFGIKAQLVALVIQAADAREQLAVEHGAVAMRGQLRRQISLQLDHGLIGVGAGKAVEDRRHAVEQGA